MIYDLAFWKQVRTLDATPAHILGQLSTGRTVEGLEPLPLESFLSHIADAFPGTKRGSECLEWESSDRGAFQATGSPQHVRICCIGMSEEDMNRFIDIAEKFECPLFDPQTGVRYVEELDAAA